ncbi:hypothetical protein J0X19_02765 [Hymenobacter sp. BT186]|uniref:Uncharacterized protein n=1 Tax=Hymenobacter telluris TaxID=2816474 RepID=A0A939ETU8_9BACT|nr:hypothetical protein [Hymenobacter telluris]MBO0356856.1 hypothetical protein [Hymenobacter telluris]MBW3372882.1 hypothetical protein [Hymenobacter norwichensis]
MSSTTYSLDCGKLQILDLDANEYGSFIALMSNMEVWTNRLQLALPHQFRYGFIRKLDNKRFLLIGEQVGSTSDTGHIFDYTGRQLLSFDAGRYIADVLVQANRIVVSYFDQAAGQLPPSNYGLTVFDFGGRQVFGHNSDVNGFILDCYCMCKLGNDSILAYTYTDFPLRELRLTDYQLKQQSTPTDFKGAHALTSDRGNVVFYSSYEDKTSFFWWNRKDKVQRFGHYIQIGPIRGIGNGKFLTYNANSFSILDAMEIMREESQNKHN